MYSNVSRFFLQFRDVCDLFVLGFQVTVVSPEFNLFLLLAFVLGIFKTQCFVRYPVYFNSDLLLAVISPAVGYVIQVSFLVMTFLLTYGLTNTIFAWFLIYFNLLSIIHRTISSKNFTHNQFHFHC